MKLAHLVILAAFAASGLDSTADAQSLWNSEGLGGWNDGYDFAARGAGWTGIGRIDRYQMGAMNPAAPAWARAPQAQLGILVDNAWSSTESAGDGGRAGSTRLPGIAVAIPIRRGIGINLGFRDLTVGSYAYAARINPGAGDEYRRRIEGSGGLSQFQVGVTARALDSRLGVGLLYGVVGGTLRDLIEDDFSSGEFQDTRNLLRTRMEGGRPVSFGVQARPIAPIECGATFTTSSGLDLRSLFENRTGNREESRARMDLPAAFGIGATVHASPQWLISADYSARAWSKHAFETIDSLGVAVGRDFAGLDDARRIGVGFTRLPGEHTPKDPLFQRAVYRAGFTHAVLPSRQSNGAEVKEWALTAGIGLPVQVDRGYIDGLIEFGKRGDADTDLSETFLRLGFSVTFGKLEDAF